jgi:hypothetical protein
VDAEVFSSCPTDKPVMCHTGSSEGDADKLSQIYNKAKEVGIVEAE